MEIFEWLGLEVPKMTEEQLAELVAGVNPDRLRNHPIYLDNETIRRLYGKILRKEEV